LFACSKVGQGLFYTTPEVSVVARLVEVNKFVDYNVVDDAGWELDDAPMEIERTGTAT